MVGKSLPDAITAPPEGLRKFHLIGVEDLLRLFVKVRKFDIFDIGAAGKFDVETA